MKKTLSLLLIAALSLSAAAQSTARKMVLKNSPDGKSELTVYLPSAEAAQRAKAQFNAEVERLAPGLAAAVREHAAEWQKWAASPIRAASVAQAFASNDAGTVAEFLGAFAQSNGIRANGDGIAARPSSSYSPRGGSHPVSTGGDTATYTVDQYSEAMRRAGEDYNAGKITADDYRAIKKKFETALNEGRIVKQ